MNKDPGTLVLIFLLALVIIGAMNFGFISYFVNKRVQCKDCGWSGKDKDLDRDNGVVDVTSLGRCPKCKSYGIRSLSKNGVT